MAVLTQQCFAASSQPWEAGIVATELSGGRETKGGQMTCPEPPSQEASLEPWVSKIVQC